MKSLKKKPAKVNSSASYQKQKSI